MDSKKKKLLLASVAGLLTVAGFAANTQPAYAMGKKPRHDANSCNGKANSCNGKANSCNGKTAQQ